MNYLMQQKRQQVTVNSTFLSAKVFLGTEKTGSGSSTRPGQDLKTRFRVVPSSKMIASILKESYPEAEKVGDSLLIEKLNIYAYAESIESTVQWDASVFAGNKLVRTCDRQTMFEMETQNGYQVRSEGKPCCMAGQGLHIPCSKGCKPTLRFSFYIKEVFDGFHEENGHFINNYGGRSDLPCRLTIVGLTNQRDGGLIDQLMAIENYVGSIKCAPVEFWNQFSGRLIPLQLSRIEIGITRPEIKKTEGGYTRTGNRCSGVAYPVVVEIHPLWIQAFNAWQNQRFMSAFETQAIAPVQTPKIEQKEVKAEVKAIAPVPVVETAIEESPSAIAEKLFSMGLAFSDPEVQLQVKNPEFRERWMQLKKEFETKELADISF